VRTILAKDIAEKVRGMCIEANCVLPDDIVSAIAAAQVAETSERARTVLEKLLENAEIARNESVPICQDTGMAVFFVEIGQEVYIDGSVTAAINEGARRGYAEGCLRKRVVADPLLRGNTGDNTPAIIHYDVVEGGKLKITFAPKGFGSENMSALKMLKPSDGVEGVADFVLRTVKNAGPNPCPPVVLGVGIGGTMEKCALLAKKALTRDVGAHHPNPYYRDLELRLLKEINGLNIGPQGYGGATTALWLAVETFPTHIAGLPVAVNVNCHVARHLTAEL
jgi:fumarate hydratase subunit alpha